jgi:hypothetical protein
MADLTVAICAAAVCLPLIERYLANAQEADPEQAAATGNRQKMRKISLALMFEPPLLYCHQLSF